MEEFYILSICGTMAAIPLEWRSSKEENHQKDAFWIESNNESRGKFSLIGKRDLEQGQEGTDSESITVSRRSYVSLCPDQLLGNSVRAST
jgi:hypothetical protein